RPLSRSRPEPMKPGAVECVCCLRQMGRAGALNRSRSWRRGCGRPAAARGRSARGGCPCPVQLSPGSGDDRACGGDRRRRPDRADWVGEFGVPILRGRDVVGFAQDDTGVDVEVSGDTSVRAEYLVGCDGGRSLIRKAAGIEFAGLDPSTSWMIAEVEMDEEPELGFRRDSVGQHAIGRRQEGEPVRLVLTEPTVDHTGEPSMDELREALVSVYGTDFGLRRASWISRFTDMTRQAASYRHRRVLLAGDAAHVHPPQGGQGLNTGVQDSVNLGWKLAQVVEHRSPESLLDTFHAERHPVGARVLRYTMAQAALTTPDERHQ